MLDALNFVRGAVAKKDYQPALQHFRLADGKVMGFNGMLALCSPIALDVRACPQAIPFVRAIENCKDETAVYLTQGGKLALRSGDFRVYIECFDDHSLFEALGTEPIGQEIPQPQMFMQALKTLEPFIGVDASRPWATGILLRGESAFATNNVIIIEHWLGTSIPFSVNIPGAAVREIIRIAEPPQRLLLTDNALTLVYGGGRWLRTILSDPEWPVIDPILSIPANPLPIPEDFFAAVQSLVPFAGLEGRIFLRGQEVKTSIEADDGATKVLALRENDPGCAWCHGQSGQCACNAPLPMHGAFNHLYLSMLKGVATHIDFDAHPKPCTFVGNMLRGVMLGLTDA